MSRDHLNANLIHAIYENDLNLALNALRAGANPNYMNALILAIERREVDMVQLLIHYGADVNSMTHNALEAAMAVEIRDFRTMEIIRKLLWSGASPNMITSSGQTPLIVATKDKDIVIISLFMKFGGNPFMRDARGWSALTVAISQNNFNIAKTFLNSSLSASSLVLNQAAALSLTGRQKDERLTEALIKKGAKDFGTSIVKFNEMNWSEYRPLRAGVIPYVIEGNKRLFCLGIDRESNEISDFGGSLDARIDPTGLSTAMREFSEESLKIFNPYAKQYLNESDIIANPAMCIIFLKVDVNPEQIQREFERKVRAGSEMRDILWLNSDTFYHGIMGAEIEDPKTHTMHELYYRVAKFLKIEDIYAFLLLVPIMMSH